MTHCSSSSKPTFVLYRVHGSSKLCGDLPSSFFSSYLPSATFSRTGATAAALGLAFGWVRFFCAQTEGAKLCIAIAIMSSPIHQRFLSDFGMQQELPVPFRAQNRRVDHFDL